MYLASRADLETYIADLLDRTDLAKHIPLWITLLEASLNRDLRHHDMVKRCTAETDRQYTMLPADWLETIRIEPTSNGVPHDELIYKEPRDLLRLRSANPAFSMPRYYTMLGRRIEMSPLPVEGVDIELEIFYYQRIALGDLDGATNWLLTAAPDVYVYGALAHSAPFLKNDERLQMWSQLYTSATTSLMNASERSQVKGSRLNRTVSSRGF